MKFVIKIIKFYDNCPLSEHRTTKRSVHWSIFDHVFDSIWMHTNPVALRFVELFFYELRPLFIANKYNIATVNLDQLRKISDQMRTNSLAERRGIRKCERIVLRF